MIPSLRVLVVADSAGLHSYPTGAHPRLTAQTTGDAIRTIEQERPGLVVIDWDLPDIDAVTICRAAMRFPMMNILMTTDRTETVPAAIRSGCRAVLLKPFARNLAAARIGRLSRQMLSRTTIGSTGGDGRGTNRRWLDLACPRCSTPGVTSFEFSSHRQLWFACLECSHVWRGPEPDRAGEAAPDTEAVPALPRAG